MSNELSLESDPDQLLIYGIRLKGHLGTQWADHHTLEANGDTLLTGTVVDQTAMQGLLKKVLDLRIPLISGNNRSRLSKFFYRQVKIILEEY